MPTYRVLVEAKVRLEYEVESEDAETAKMEAEELAHSGEEPSCIWCDEVTSVGDAVLADESNEPVGVDEEESE